MNLKKFFIRELLLALAILLVEIIYLLLFSAQPLHIEMLVQTVVVFNVYIILKLWQKKEFILDEREAAELVKTGFLSAFIFIYLLVICFYVQDELQLAAGINIKEIWGRFLLALYLIIHALTGLIKIKKEEVFD